MRCALSSSSAAPEYVDARSTSSRRLSRAAAMLASSCWKVSLFMAMDSPYEMCAAEIRAAETLNPRSASIAEMTLDITPQRVAQQDRHGDSCVRAAEARKRLRDLAQRELRRFRVFHSAAQVRAGVRRERLHHALQQRLRGVGAQRQGAQRPPLTPRRVSGSLR